MRRRSLTSRASTIPEEDDYHPQPKYERPKTFNKEYSPTYTEDMVWLARTYMGLDVQAYLDAKYKGTLPDDWDEVEKILQTRYMPFDHTVRVEL